MTVPVLIPWRDSGCPHRRANMRRVVEHYSQRGPVVLGDAPGDPFSRSAARNAAARDSDGDVLAFVDADAVLDLNRLDEAIGLARQAPGLVRPFARAGFVTEAATRAYLDGGPLADDFMHGTTEGFIGLAWVIRRDAFESLGGFDPGFVGYGGEDNAFSAACDRLLGRPRNVDGTAYSLWHPAERVTAPASLARLRPYYRVRSWADYRALRPDLLEP